MNRNNLQKLINVIGIKSIDINTAEGRSFERIRRVFWTAISSGLAKGISTLTILISVPITLKYLGMERYGVWMTISSFVSFLGFADLGIGNGLLNLIAESHGKNDNETARKGIASSFFLLFCIASIIALIFIICYPLINWGNTFNISSNIARVESGPAFFVLMICILVNLPLSIVPRIQMGIQEGYVNSFFEVISGSLGLILLLIVVHFKGGLPWLVLVISGSPAIANFLNAINLFLIKRPWLLPKRKDINLNIALKIAYVGIFFVVLQLTNAINYSADNLIIAKILGPEAVTEYSIPFKLFSIITSVVYMILYPLWPAYGEAVARGDFSWAKKTLSKIIPFSFLLCSIFSIIIIVFGKQIIQIWTGSANYYSFPLMVSFGIWITLQSVITSIALFLNALNKIKIQAFFAILTAIFSVLTRILLSRQIGLLGIVWANIIISMIFMLLPYSIFLWKYIRKKQTI